MAQYLNLQQIKYVRQRPDMQTVMLQAAEAAGAEVLRDAVVLGVAPSRRPTVRARISGGEERQFGARLIVGADGRNFACRAQAGFEVHRDPQRMIVAGALIQGFGAPADRISSIMDPVGSRTVGGQNGVCRLRFGVPERRVRRAQGYRALP